MQYSVHIEVEHYSEIAMDAPKEIRQTVNVSMPPALKSFAKDRAEQRHGNNISHYIQTLIRADMKGSGQTPLESQQDSEVAQSVSVA